MAVNETPRDIRVVGAQTGSIIITLATTYGIARVISAVLLKALEVAEKVQGLRKAQLEIQALHLSNQQALAALKEQEESERAGGLKAIAESVSTDLELDGEKVNALEKSIRKLLSFIELGGGIDLILPFEGRSQPENLDPEEKKLSLNVTRIRELERSQRLMSHLYRKSD